MVLSFPLAWPPLEPIREGPKAHHHHSVETSSSWVGNLNRKKTNDDRQESQSERDRKPFHVVHVLRFHEDFVRQLWLAAL